MQIVLNKMIAPPTANSRDMRAYMQAILEVTGLMAGECFDISDFMGNYRTHLVAGRLVIHANGQYSLSDKGRQYFISRLTSAPAVKGQNVSREEVIYMVRKITAETPAPGWIPLV